MVLVAGVLVLVVVAAAVLLGRVAARGGVAFLGHTADSWREGRVRIRTPAPEGMCRWCRERPAEAGSNYCSSEHELEDDWANNA